MRALSLAAARRIALASQGFDRPRPKRVDVRGLRRELGRLGLLQIDSVNVLSRAHYVPLFSRLGPYDRERLDALAWGEGCELFEYWGHEASLLPVDLEPSLRWRKARTHRWTGPEKLASRRPDLVAALESAVLEDGPITAGELADRFGGARTAGPWWGWGDTKV